MPTPPPKTPDPHSLLSDIVDRVEGALGKRPRQEAAPTYEYTHRYVYTLDDGSQVVAEPFSILLVDDDHPFPEDLGLNLVQIAELAEVAISLLANLIVKLTNLLNQGAISSETPDGATSAAEISGADFRILDALVADLIQKKSSLSAISSAAHLERTGPAERSAAHADRLREVVSNTFTFLVEEAAQVILRFAGMYGTAIGMDQFADLFQTIVAPNVLHAWKDDHEFAKLRVAGPNPNMIQRVRGSLPAKFAVTDAAYKQVMGAQDSLAQAIEDKRLYYVDYVELDHQESGSVGDLQKHANAPMALFAVPLGGGDLRPVAIQIKQEASTQNPVFYPFHDQTWTLAKLHVQVADANYHEIVSHLTLTHLLLEPLVVSTHRKLAANHPLYILLMPHYQGTLFINNAAFAALINPGGIIDQTLSGTIESDWKVATNAMANLSFDDWMLPRELESRGVADPDLPLEFPYRDDALLLWQTIHAWVRSYLAVYYSHDDDVAGDTQLQAWVQDLVSADGGRIGGLGQERDDTVGIYTFDYLVDVVTMTIFTASVQHAAVNFPQRTIMSYTPAMPLAAYQPAPIRTEGVNPGQGVLETLPPLQRATIGMITLQALGGVYFTRLGDYDRHQRGSYFKDARVAGALNQFRAALSEVEATINERNRSRECYTTLLPSRIPQSINI